MRPLTLSTALRARSVRGARAAIACGACALASCSSVAHAFEDQGTPRLLLGPTWAVRTPYQIVGVGGAANVRVDHVLNVFGTASVGLALDKDQNDNRVSPFFELYAGVPVVSWDREKEIAVGLSREPKESEESETVTYRPVRVPVHDAIIAEVGALSGYRAFTVAPSAAGGGGGGASALPQTEGHRVWTLAAGARYSWSFSIREGQDRYRSYSAVWAHVLVGGFGAPTGDGAFLGRGTTMPDDKSTSRPVGGKVGGSIALWPNGFVTLDAEVGLLPAGGLWYAAIGNTIPFWL
jgi:hypothetical protein